MMKPFPDKMTIGEKYKPAMRVQTEVEAAEHLEACIEHTMRVSGKKLTYDEAKAIELQNIGYYAGYSSTDEMQRINKLYGTTHPIFGKRIPTAEEAMQAGKEKAKAIVDANE